MYENATTYTWWDIEDCVGSLAVQAVNRWETLGLPKDTAGTPVVLRTAVTDKAEIVYTITLFHGDTAVYTAEGEIQMSGVPSHIAATAAESTIFESAAELVGEDVASKLIEGLLSWLRRQ
jgi:hypothetical protein